MFRSFAGAAAAGTAQPIFALYLKASTHPKYTIVQINNYPTASSAVGVVSTLAYAWISDGVLSGRRWPLLVFAAVSLRRTAFSATDLGASLTTCIQTVNFIMFTSLAVWDISEGWLWACYLIAGQVVSISPMALA
jgi:ACS family pantothenate transporter-like MFS transporter